MSKKHIIIGLLVILLIPAVGFGIRWAMAPAKGALEKREQVYSGSNQIQSYEHFYDLCVAIQRKQEGIRAQEEALKTAKDPHYRQRVQTRLSALRTQLQSDVAQYNADARKVETKAKFIGEDLPKRISAERKVTCR